ncbi:hypothetical protein MalM25_00050 [Planctomycetes bacterium MalM25]|nr:hypothetical protein MalM25_00050 [Planctomycetes bacterium MalM25]
MPEGLPSSTERAAAPPLEEVVEEAYHRVAEVVAEGRDRFDSLDLIEDCVSIKNPAGVVVHCNTAHRRALSPQESPLGRTAHAYLDPSFAHRIEAIERLIGDDCPFLECEHSGRAPDGAYVRIHSRKRSLRELGNSGLSVLSVMRIIDRDESIPKRLDLAALCNKYRELSQRDQEICRLTASGASSRELGELMDLTTRGVELRKQKAFAHLGVAKAVDLARLLVRLQDGGYLDLGL